MSLPLSFKSCRGNDDWGFERHILNMISNSDLNPFRALIYLFFYLFPSQSEMNCDALNKGFLGGLKLVKTAHWWVWGGGGGRYWLVKCCMRWAALRSWQGVLILRPHHKKSFGSISKLSWRWEKERMMCFISSQGEHTHSVWQWHPLTICLLFFL